VRRIALAAVLALLLGACNFPLPWDRAGNDVGVGVGGTGNVGVPDPVGQPQMVEPQGPTANPHPVTFEVAAVDGATITVAWWSGVAPCSVLDEVVLAEDDEAVTITVIEGADRAQPDAVCIDIAVQKATVVVLAADLGERTVIDGSTGAPATLTATPEGDAPADQPDGGVETVPASPDDIGGY
jgi:hypothetical protein